VQPTPQDKGNEVEEVFPFLSKVHPESHRIALCLDLEVRDRDEKGWRTSGCLGRGHTEGKILEAEFDLDGDFVEESTGDDGFLAIESFFLQLSGYFDDIGLDYSRQLGVLMLEIDCDFDEVVDVEGRAAIGAAIAVLDLLHFVLPGVHLSPGRPVGH
jgi:hypothetical protein